MVALMKVHHSASLVCIVIRLNNAYKETIFNIIDLINIILYYYELH